MLLLVLFWFLLFRSLLHLPQPASSFYRHSELTMWLLFPSTRFSRLLSPFGAHHYYYTTVFICDCTIFMAHLGQGAPVVQRVAEVSSALYLKALIMPLNSAPLYVKRHIIHSYIHIERHNTITHIHSLVPSKVLTIIHLRIHQ